MNWMEQLSENMEIYYRSTNIAVTILSPEGKTFKSFGEECAYCRIFREACGQNCPCQDAHFRACKEASRLMDGYTFSCPGGYVHFMAPVYRNKILLACVLAGPIALEYPDMVLIDSIMQEYDLDIGYRARLYGAYADAPLVEPSRAHHLCRLLAKLTPDNSFIEDNSLMRRRIAQDIQQARIGEYIQLLKDDDSTTISRYDQENQLVAAVTAGNITQAKFVLNNIIGQVYFSSGNNFEIIRTRTIELVGLLSRTLIENGLAQTTVYRMTEESFQSIMAEKNLTGLSYTLLEILDMFMTLSFSERKVPDAPGLQKAIAYIDEHYYESVTLEDVAAHVGLNTTYFSTMFKRQMQVNFSEYLSAKRINQAKLLLRNSNMPIVDISIAVGFENQSYFSKVFKRKVGMTPRHFRETLS